MFNCVNNLNTRTHFAETDCTCKYSLSFKSFRLCCNSNCPTKKPHSTIVPVKTGRWLLLIKVILYQNCCLKRIQLTHTHTLLDTRTHARTSANLHTRVLTRTHTWTHTHASTHRNWTEPRFSSSSYVRLVPLGQLGSWPSSTGIQKSSNLNVAGLYHKKQSENVLIFFIFCRYCSAEQFRLLANFFCSFQVFFKKICEGCH